MPNNGFVLIVGLGFLAFGTAMLFLPFDVLRRYDKATGAFIIKRAPDEATGLRQARFLYRLMGVGFLILAAINLLAFLSPANPQGSVGGKAPTNIYVDWLWSLNVRETDQGSSSPAQTMPTFPKHVERVYLTFYTHSLAGRTLQYRWTVNDALQKEFHVQMSNGDNAIELSKPDAEDLPSGNHEVTISLDGGTIAVARFVVE
jgi:hypothetical protein